MEDSKEVGVIWASSKGLYFVAVRRETVTSQSVLGHEEVLLASHNPWATPRSGAALPVPPLPSLHFSAAHGPLSSVLAAPARSWTIVQAFLFSPGPS